MCVAHFHDAFRRGQRLNGLKKLLFKTVTLLHILLGAARRRCSLLGPPPLASRVSPIIWLLSLRRHALALRQPGSW